ncbi:MAG TPA: NAD-dependent epimerase/dehydratase family protein [Chitinophaga sp.]|uniref:NAD-dependent epimerase/dehydratase family protein n=1 Tax=Chitinophaga sp. TaxID=1869181 RepID=UPI002C0A75AE|nr:NAD-dependent epimerase/dehydratase family protein [Chitinophaga sp.]HVI44229.1 NAD-dependent epimerase/dehydratase family protein [Chitinophaga sp.]
MKVIITGATGMVGEGVLLECLQQPDVAEVLLVGRRHYDLAHPKLKELIMLDFLHAAQFRDLLQEYDACFFCAGISSVGMDEATYSRATYDVTIQFAKVLAEVNPGMVFSYVSGRSTDSTEKGRIMWARVKGKTENDLMKLPFKSVYCFRPALMKPLPEQKNVKSLYKVFNPLYPLFRAIGWGCTLREVGQAMMNTVRTGYPKHVLEVKDILALAAGA